MRIEGSTRIGGTIKEFMPEGVVRRVHPAERSRSLIFQQQSLTQTTKTILAKIQKQAAALGYKLLPTALVPA